mmetsp:Transcript_13556/g.28752  ORF Transcript_13556/g.28752 Transcript_13556/m.28752 type:complete len:237 (-) Transcript_13556:1141-1851(-)
MRLSVSLFTVMAPLPRTAASSSQTVSNQHKEPQKNHHRHSNTRSIQAVSSNCGPEAVALEIQTQLFPSVSNNSTIDPYFSLVGAYSGDIAYPYNVDCITSKYDTCTNLISFGDEYGNSAGDDISAVFAGSKLPLEEPCTQCSYDYSLPEMSKAGVCPEVSCDAVECLPGLGIKDGNGTTESVTMCLKHSRYDSFSTNELRFNVDGYNCRIQTAKIVRGGGISLRRDEYSPYGVHHL